MSQIQTIQFSLPTAEKSGIITSVPEETGKLKDFSTKTPIFVVGPPRSGTSLLYAILNQHPQIALMYECNVWKFPEMLSGLRWRGEWRERLEFYDSTLSRHRLVLGNSLAGLENVRTPADLYRAFAETKQAQIFGEKSPFYCNRLLQIAQNYPDCSFILIWRDPMEIYRSIQDAAGNDYYFRRHGMLSRLIFYQEKMIHQAARLGQAGSRILHVTYNDLIDHREESCGTICRFLGIEFDKKMLDLTGADLSAVFRTPMFEFLRRGVIERRQIASNGEVSRYSKKLQRFNNRWNRLRQQKLGFKNVSESGPEPALPERLYHHWTGSFLCARDTAIRVFFEFLPLSWLRTYREAKVWFKAGRPGDPAEQTTLRDDFLAHKATVLLSIVILAVVAAADYLTGVAISLMPFYIIPAAILTLVINQRWGTLAAAVSALVWASIQNVENPDVNFSHPGVCLWDTFMRFVVVQIIVLLLERIRQEISPKKKLID